MNNNGEKIYEIMSEALKLKEEGKSVSEILNLFAENKKELEEIFQIIDFLSREKEKIKPTEDALKKIVTNQEISRYLQQEGEIKPFEFAQGKGRPSILQILFDMKKIYIGAGLIVLLLIAASVIYVQIQKVAVAPDKGAPTEELAGKTAGTAVTETASIETIEGELALELDSFANDLADLEGFNNDTSLENLETGLSGVIQ